jgi:hypothetical protein
MLAYSIMYLFIFQRRLCILLHISEKIVYFTSYFRQDCVFMKQNTQSCLKYEARHTILSEIWRKIHNPVWKWRKIHNLLWNMKENTQSCLKMKQNFRHDCAFCFIFKRRLCISLHISDKIGYFPSYYRQDCVFCFIYQRRLCILLHFQTRLCIFLHIKYEAKCTIVSEIWSEIHNLLWNMKQNTQSRLKYNVK